MSSEWHASGCHRGPRSGSRGRALPQKRPKTIAHRCAGLLRVEVGGIDRLSPHTRAPVFEARAPPMRRTSGRFGRPLPESASIASSRHSRYPRSGVRHSRRLERRRSLGLSQGL